MLVGVARTYGVDVHGQRIVEGGAVETVRRLDKSRLILFVVDHLGQTCQRLAHAADLACNVHVPHLIAVARTGTPLLLRAAGLDIGAVVHAVPHPKAHILGYEQRLVGDSVVVDVCRDIYKPRQLLVYRIIGRPHPAVVVIRAVHLDQGGVLCRYGVQISVSVLAILSLVTVEVLPRSLHVPQLLFGCKVPCLPVAAQRVAPYKRPLLTLAQLVDHARDVAAQRFTLVAILAAGVCKGHGRHVVSRAVSLEFRCGRIPSVRYGVAVGRQAVCVAVVIELLRHVERQQVIDGKIPV